MAVINRLATVAVARRAASRVARLALVACLAGCVVLPVPTPPPQPVVDKTEAGLEFANWLELHEAQRPRMIALVGKVERIVEPLRWAGEGMLRAAAAAARRCHNDSTFLQMRAESFVSAGQEARAPLLDAITELHAILTPKQRRALVQHLLAAERDSTPEEREDTSSDEAKSVQLDLELSLTQLGSLLVRLHMVQGIYEDKAEPWLARYRAALRAFARADFDIRDHEIAEVPILKLATDLLRDAYRVVVPLLEPEQCRVAGEYIDARLDEAERERQASEQQSQRDRDQVAQ